jgi:hypothetical protein
MPIAAFVLELCFEIRQALRRAHRPCFTTISSSRAASSVEQAGVPGTRDSFEAIGSAQFAEDAANVCLDGCHADDQLGRDALV